VKVLVGLCQTQTQNLTFAPSIKLNDASNTKACIKLIELQA